MSDEIRHAYTLLGGAQLSLGGLEGSELAYLERLKAKADANEDYFVLLREVRGRESVPLWNFHGQVTPEAAQSIFFQVALDIVERVGLRQGRVLDPAKALPEAAMRFVSIAEAARVIGMSRQAVHKALQNKKILGWLERRPGYGASTWLVDLESALRYKKGLA
jgi:hypothetical protein